SILHTTTTNETLQTRDPVEWKYAKPCQTQLKAKKKVFFKSTVDKRQPDLFQSDNFGYFMNQS
ncbi:MAG: hypothetical protein ACKOA8_19350, partial [Deltaproteobacteria bacterium]